MKKKVMFVSLGCDKNLVDSEKMLGMLEQSGYTFTDDETEADIVVVNTCCFIGDAKEESVNTILEMAELKKSGDIEILIVTGCLAQRYQEEVRKEIEEVDAVIGTTAIDELLETLDEVYAGKRRDHYQNLSRIPLTDGKRIVTTGGHYAYLKIAEGCDKHCTY
ncbi:MAG: 30S ribosomal protein S12 methylthiotransferase RimO, partial [Lachnospiraceae bacterium]|nr:30S ribosomal protein S12 methylthiotransferase RimO [Lachnospiraceae bacterium]